MGGVTAAAGGRNVDSTDLLSLQSRMKKDPLSYEQELLLQLRHFDACVSILLLQSSSAGQISGGQSSAAGDVEAAKDVAEVAMFLAHMAPFYPQHLRQIPQRLLQVLRLHATLQPSLRRSLTQSIILLRNKKLVEMVDILPILMDLQCNGYRAVRKLAFLHIVHDIRRMNLKHKSETINRRLQAILFTLLQGEDEVKAKRALMVLAELHRRKVWTDERTANAVCTACLHKSPRIMIAALRFLLGYDQQKDEEEGESSDSDEEAGGKDSASVDRAEVYKAYHKGTPSSKKKKQNKLQRAVRSMQKQQRAQSREMEQGSYAPLQHLVDPQTFAEKLFGRLRSSNDRYEVKLMMMQVISRAIGMHRLMLLNFYPFLQKYIEPHQRDVTQVLAAAVQACHDLVPPDAVESLLRQLVNHFVHDRARPEVIAVGLNVTREICMRIPLVMTPELLTDLALYKKNREKGVAAAARSIISVYRQLWPSILEKRDRGRNADLSATPKAFGATTVATGVTGLELLLEGGNDTDGASENEGDSVESSEGDDDIELRSGEDQHEDDNLSDSDLELGLGRMDDQDYEQVEEIKVDQEGTLLQHSSEADDGGETGDGGDLSKRASKRRRVEEQPNDISIDLSLRNLRRLSSAKDSQRSTLSEDGKGRDDDGILSNDDFARIRSLQMKRAAKDALATSGLRKTGGKAEAAVKLPSPESLSGRRLNPSVLEAHVRKRLEKEERIAMAKAGREDRQPYGSRTATKQKKTGGSSNRQKEKLKAMPLGAVRSKMARQKDRRTTSRRSDKKQFRGKKAWK